MNLKEIFCACNVIRRVGKFTIVYEYCSEVHRQIDSKVLTPKFLYFLILIIPIITN